MSQNPLRIVLAALSVAAALFVALGPGAAADDTDPVAIAEAPPLTWGFKQSWRSYAGYPDVSDGATQTPASGNDSYGLAWEFDSGTYDADSGTTELHYKGTVRWHKYYLPDNPFLNNPPPGYAGPFDIELLDVTMEDPTIRIGPDSATISVEARSRQLDTWQMLDAGRIDVVNLDASAVTPVVDAGTTTWSGIPATTNEGSSPVFAGNYPPGRAVDSVGFSYTGPGGAPDFSEEWDEPGTTKLGSATQNTILATEGTAIQYMNTWVDRGRRLVHQESRREIDGQLMRIYQAFSIDAMQNVGEPLIVPYAERISTTTLFDSNTGRLYYRQSGESSTTRWLAYDAGQGKYVRGAIPTPIPLIGTAVNNISWDSVGQRAFNIRRVVPAGVPSNDYDNHDWQLNVYERSGDSWTATSYALPRLPHGLNQRGYPEGNATLAAPNGIAARDGSLLMLGSRQTSNDPGVVAPETVPGVWRVVIAGGQATIAPVPGTDVPNSTSGLYDGLRAGPDGQVALFREGVPGGGIPHLVQDLTVSQAGTVTVEPPVDLGDFDAVGGDSFAVDPTDGTAWIGGFQSQRLVGVKDGKVVADQLLTLRHPRGGPVVVGPDHAVYPQSNDGSPPIVGGSPIYGFGRYERLGWSPDVTADPAPQSVALSAGEESEPVGLSSSATADPAPERQWQVKAPGAVRFTDIAGETGPTLTVAAERGMGGSEYRAVYSNAAGQIASDPATLSVDYAPEISVDAADVTVTEGEPAVFQVLSQGEPEPALTWQRRVGGFWQDVAADDENFEIGSGMLTIPETNLDQSGALFRLKVSNGVGATYSRAVKLTVTSGANIPPGGLSLDGVSLDWTGSPELQRKAPNQQPNFLSAGVSDGFEATYRSESAGVRVLHRDAGGQLASATWATRGAQTAGGVTQLVRLLDGHAEIEEDGSGHVTWDGSFSVNFYGGLVPFTLSDAELTVDADGDGTLTADLSGYGASQANPSDRHPIAPVADVTVATFSGVEVDPDGAVEVAPDYAAVEVDAPAGFGAQDRVSAGWGAWPQEFVDFHGATGLAPYWYSSGGAFDPHKSADPFTVDFTGAGSLPPLVDDGDVFPPAVDRPSTTSLSLGRSHYGRPATATVRVSSAAAAAPGKVRVRVAGRSVAGALRDGAVRLRLPGGIQPGAHAVRADYAGAPGIAASSARGTLRIAKARPRVSFAVRRRGAAARLSIVARIPQATGVHPTGQLVVRDRGEIVAVRKLGAARRGRLVLALPELGRGVHFLRVGLIGNSRQYASSSAYRMLSVR